MNKRLSVNGFTLLEVLVALVIVTVTMGALLQNVGLITRNEATLQTKQLLSWVAQNQLHELQLDTSHLSVGEKKGVSEMAGQRINWSADVVQTPNPKLFEVTLIAEFNQHTQRIHGYIGKN